MADLVYLNDEALQKVMELSELLSHKAWSEHSREGIVVALEQSVEKLSELKAVLEKIEKELGAEAEPKIRQHISEMEKEIVFLNRNLEFEKKKKPIAEDLLQPQKYNEQYSAIEQRILSTLLKTRYLVERTQLQARKQTITPIKEKSTAKNLLDLLKAKESEIESMKEKYSEARKHALTGMAELEDSATIENEMNALARKLEVQQSDLEKAYFESQKGLGAMQNSNLMLRKEVMKLQQVFTNYMAKNFELITLLKKERDYAKKIVLDIEHETMQLRSAYSKELFSMQEAKVSAKREAEEKFLNRIRKIEKDNSQKQQLTGQLQGMLQDREKKLSELEEKNQKLRLLLKAKEKHDAVKKAFKQRTRHKG